MNTEATDTVRRLGLKRLTRILTLVLPPYAGGREREESDLLKPLATVSLSSRNDGQ